MKRVAALVLSACLTACSGSRVVHQLTNTKWGNEYERCSVNYITFDDGKIAVHPWGQTLLMWEIKQITPAWFSATDVAVQVEPSQAMIDRMKKLGKYQLYRPGLVLNLRIKGDRLFILSTSLGGETKSIRPGDRMSMFNTYDCSVESKYVS